MYEGESKLDLAYFVSFKLIRYYHKTWSKTTSLQISTSVWLSLVHSALSMKDFTQCHSSNLLAMYYQKTPSKLSRYQSQRLSGCHQWILPYQWRTLHSFILPTYLLRTTKKHHHNYFATNLNNCLAVTSGFCLINEGFLSLTQNFYQSIYLGRFPQFGG